MSIEITMSKTAHSSGVLCLRSGFQYGNAAKIFTHPPSANNLTFATISDTILRMPRKNKILNIGDTAPVFTLPSHQRKKVSLETYRETQHVVLTFFRGTW